jgi:DNA polymerase
MPTDAHEFFARLRLGVEVDQLFGLDQVPISKETLVMVRGHRKGSGTSGASTAEKTTRLEVLDTSQVSSCRKCELSTTRTRTVFGQGSADARLVFVGEAPGFEEDKQGLAFVGRAGQLLTKMIEAMGLSRDDVFICNVLKCRPPNNRTPAQDEISACSPYLFEQLQIIEPEVVCALGAPASQTLLRTREGIGRLRGRFHEFYPSGTSNEGQVIPLMPTYHPAYLLRSPGEKSKAWQDLQMVMKRLGLKSPA